MIADILAVLIVAGIWSVWIPSLLWRPGIRLDHLVAGWAMLSAMLAVVVFVLWLAVWAISHTLGAIWL